MVVLEVTYLGCSDIDTDEFSHFRSPNKTSSKGRGSCMGNSFLSQDHEQVLRIYSRLESCSPKGSSFQATDLLDHHHLSSGIKERAFREPLCDLPLAESPADVALVLLPYQGLPFLLIKNSSRRHLSESTK